MSADKDKLFDAALDSLRVMASLWHEGYVDLPATRPIWAINTNQITVGDVRRARIALGLSVEREEGVCK